LARLRVPELQPQAQDDDPIRNYLDAGNLKFVHQDLIEVGEPR
jgi:hypothetical protein